jgi:hypothetical protein
MILILRFRSNLFLKKYISMDKKFYNILWIDDEHHELKSTKFTFRDSGINLIGYKSSNGGMAELDRNSFKYDGILLDAKFFQDEDDEKGAESVDNVYAAKEHILKYHSTFDILVYTAQAEAHDDQMFKRAFPNTFLKNNEEQKKILISKIKENADLRPDTNIRQKHYRAFEVCNEKYIGENAGQDLLSLLKVKDGSNISAYFNTIRKIIEDVFVSFNKFELLPSIFVNPTVALNQSSIFLAGGNQHEKTDERYKVYEHFNETRIPKEMAWNIRSILRVAQPSSHRSELEKEIKELNSIYSLKTNLNQLMNILVWYKFHIDSKPKEKNWKIKTNDFSVKSKEKLLFGKVIGQKANLDKSFAFFEPNDGSENIFIPPHVVEKYSLIDEMLVCAVSELYVDNRTKEKRIRVKNIQVQDN